MLINLSQIFQCENHAASNVAQGKILSDVDCNNIIEYCKNYTKEKANVADFKDGDIRKSLIRWIPFNSETEKLFDIIREVAIKSNNENWKLDLTGFTEPLQFTEYHADGGHYGWHMDAGNGRLSLRKLSVVLQLSHSDDYEGGDLQVQSEGRITADRTKGNIIVFPSYMQHRVTPVTKGQRYSLVVWISGPPLR